MKVFLHPDLEEGHGRWEYLAPYNLRMRCAVLTALTLGNMDVAIDGGRYTHPCLYVKVGSQHAEQC